MSIKPLLLKYFRQERRATQHLGATLPPLKAQPKNTNASKGSLCRTTPTLETADANFAMRYLVKPRIKTGQAEALARAIALIRR